jgi:hypothetical protein
MGCQNPPPKSRLLTLHYVTPLEKKGVVEFPGLKKAMIPDTLIRLQAE